MSMVDGRLYAATLPPKIFIAFTYHRTDTAYVPLVLHIALTALSMVSTPQNHTPTFPLSVAPLYYLATATNHDHDNGGNDSYAAAPREWQ